jgi:hypothetical protein
MLDLALRRIPSGVMVHLAGETFTISDNEMVEMRLMIEEFFYERFEKEVISKDYGEWQANLHERRRPVDRNDLVELGLLKEKVKEKMERRI